MAHVLVDNEIYQLRIYATLGNQTAINRIQYQVNNHTGGSATDLEAVQQLNSTLNTAFKACVSNAALFRGMQFQRLRPLPVLVSQTDTAGAGLGTRGSTPLPGNVAGIGKWLTPSAGRKFRGRLYFPWPSTADVQSNGNPTGSLLTAYITFLNLIVPGLTVSGSGGGTAGISAYIVHKDFTVDPITGTSVEPGFGSMKRRGFFGRVNFSPI